MALKYILTKQNDLINSNRPLRAHRVGRWYVHLSTFRAKLCYGGEVKHFHQNYVGRLPNCEINLWQFGTIEGSKENLLWQERSKVLFQCENKRQSSNNDKSYYYYSYSCDLNTLVARVMKWVSEPENTLVALVFSSSWEYTRNQNVFPAWNPLGTGMISSGDQSCDSSLDESLCDSSLDQSRCEIILFP